MHSKKSNVLSHNESKLNVNSTSRLPAHSSILNKKSSVNRSLVDSSNAEMFQLSHEELNFINTLPNEVYQISLSVRNVSNKSARIKFTKPKSHFLSVNVVAESNQNGVSMKTNQENHGNTSLNTTFQNNNNQSIGKESMLSIAPGLEMKFIVTYNSEVNQIIRDRMMIYSEGGNFEYQIPICVYPTVNFLGFEGFYDFGVIKLNTVKQFTVEIQNKGKNIAEVKLESNLKGLTKARINVTPANLQIRPNEKQKITVSLCSPQACEVEGTIDLLPHYVTESFIEFSAVFCDCNRFISDTDGEQISELTLEPMFASEQTKFNLLLVNNTQKQCQYRMIRKKGTSMQSANQTKAQNLSKNNNSGNEKMEGQDQKEKYCLITPEQFGRDDEYEQNILKFSPFQGQIGPYSTKSINCEVVAKFSENDYQIFCNYAVGKLKFLPYQSTQWSYTIKTYFSDEDSPKNLTIKGQSLIPKLSLSSTYLKFGKVSVRKRSQKILKIQNLSDKPLHLKFQNSLNYRLNCTNMTINQNCSKELTVIFTPQVCGELNQVCYLKAGQFSLPFKVFGSGIFNVSPSKKILLHQSNMKNKQNSKQYTDNVNQFEEGIEIDADQLNVPQQISVINDKSMWMDETINKSMSYNFDTSLLKAKLGKTEKPIEKIKRTVKNRNGKEVVMEMNNFNSNQQVEEYPSTSKTPQEDRMISRELTLNQFRNISVGPVIIDFGEVFVLTAQKKTFHICNLNNRAILVSLDTRNQSEFEKSNKGNQIFPSESHGGISVVFQALREGPFQFPLQYIINKRHHFEILATGTALLPTVQLSKSDFKFIANDQDPTFEKRQDLILKNVYPYEVFFSFNSDKDSHFKVTPESGKISPNGKKQVCISHSFLGILQGGGKIQESLKLRIKHGQKFQIKCSSIVPDAHLTCKPNQVNFKEISICKFYQIKISIRNPSKNFTVFKVIPNKDIEDFLSIQASSTALNTDQVAEVNFKLYCSKQKLIDSGVTIIVRGGKNIFVPIRASIIIPKVKVEGDIIDFGSMPVSGNPNIKSITLVNQSPIPVELDLVLQNDSFLQKCLSIKQQDGQNVSILPVKDVKQYKVKIITVKIAKKSKVPIYLEFVPEEIKEYNFILPLYLSGCSDSFVSLQKNVTCRSLSDRLVIDHREIDFGKIIIEQSIQHIPKSFLITLKNPCEEAIEWQINESALQPFQLEKQSGVLEGFQELKLKVYLYNENVGTFERQLQFFINRTDFEPNKPYLKIIVKAEANYPELYFDRPYVIMPVVRLGQQSKAHFQIFNKGYQNLHLKHLLCQESASTHFQVNYVAGSNLSITRKSLLIKVSFKSDKPISFTYKIDFYDHHNRVFSIYVSGTADNSLYTIPQKEWVSNFESEIQTECVFLKNHLNSLGFVEQPLYDFPDSLTDSDFENLQRFLSMQSQTFDRYQKMRIGGNISINTSLNIANNSKKTNANTSLSGSESYEYLNEIIRVLKSEGAFLNEIRPQFLMKEDQFSEIIKNKGQNNKNTHFYRLPSSQQFTLQRKKSWVILIYQIIKICSKVPSKKKGNDFWSQFPAKQKTIIQWLQQCYQSESGIQELRTSNQLQDLGDGEMLCSLITKYTNIKITEYYGKNNLTYKEKQKKCKKILDTLNQIGIASGIKIEDLLKSKPRQMLLFLERLYMILPSYLQKGEPIVFSCSIGQTLTKSVQIKNPSKSPVEYLAKIQGSNAYIIQNNQQFTIEGKKKHEINIKYISNIDVDKSNATLTLTGKTSAKFTPSTFVFVLKSMSLGRISQKNIQISAQLYDPYEVEINVKNNFATDGIFNVQITSSNSKECGKNLYCPTINIKIKKGETVIVPFTFFPFIMQTYKYFIVFKDSKVGEFQYQLTGIVELPSIMNDPIRLPQTFFTSKSYNTQICIPQKNQLLLKARKLIQNTHQRNNRKNSLKNARRSVRQSQELCILYPLIKQEIYTLTLLPQNQMITLKNNTITFDTQDQESHGTSRKVNLQINMKVPVKDGVIYLMMKNKSNTDVRRYKLIINSVYKPLKYQMQIRVPVNKSLTQPLPLINVSNQTNVFNVAFITNHPTLTSTNVKSSSSSNSPQALPFVFQFPNQNQRSLKAREQSTISLVFCPRQQQQYHGLVRIENITNGQLLQYQVLGIGQEPLAETLKLNQTTLESKNYEIAVPFSHPQKYSVTKFVLDAQTPYKSSTKQSETQSAQTSKHILKYEKGFYCHAEKTSIFKFQFQSKMPNVFTGRLHIEDDNKIHAYQVLINVEEAIVGEITINAIQRVKQQKTIPLQAGKWKIEHNDSNIQIPDEILIKQQDSQKCVTFSYSSMKIGQFNDTHIIFRNDQKPHIKYLLKVKITEQPETEINYDRTILGKRQQRIIVLENPDNFGIKVEGICNNPDSFYYCLYSEKKAYSKMQKIFKIGAKQSIKLCLIYRPTCLQQFEQGTIHFISNSNQKWKYSLIGSGYLNGPPVISNSKNSENIHDLSVIEDQAFETKQIESEVNQQIFQSISFINPFKHNVQIHVFVENSPQFELVHDNNKYSLTYLEEIQIPIKFKATSIRRYTGKIKVLVNQNIYWIYAIHANIFCNCFDDPKVLKLPSRQKKQITIDFSLPLKSFNDSQANNKYMCEMYQSNHHLNNDKKTIQQAIFLKNSHKIVKQWTQKKNETSREKCYFTFSFLSYRPFSTPVLFEISQEDGSKWIYKGQIQFVSPPVDDQFQIITDINKAEKVAFRLSNRTKNYSKFNAYFTSESDMQFSIWPKIGDLQPYGREGTLLQVTFSPTQYKNNWQGKLIIQTEDSYWSYSVKGGLPHYTPPVGKSQIPCGNAKNSRMTNK